jgi:hypothetical protein
VHERRLVGVPFVLKVVQDPAEPKSLSASMLDGIVRGGARWGTTTLPLAVSRPEWHPNSRPAPPHPAKVIVSIHEEADRFSH